MYAMSVEAQEEAEESSDARMREVDNDTRRCGTDGE